jgi:integrase
MANTLDKRYLKKQWNAWYYVRVLPKKYRPYFINEKTGKQLTTYKRATGCSKLDEAVIQRNIFNVALELLFKDIDTGGGNSVTDKARKNLKELASLRKIQFTPDATEQDQIGAEELQELKEQEVLDQASNLFLKTNPKEFEEASRTPDGSFNIEQGIIKLDQSGQAEKFIAESFGHTFNSYVDDYCNYKKSNGSSEKKVKEFRQTINLFSKGVLVNNLNKRTVKQWARDLVLKDGMQPNSVRTKVQMLKNYLMYLTDDLGVTWANIPNPFFLQRDDLPKIIKMNKERQAWTMDEMKLVYQTETPQLKKKPELIDLMVLAMVYGCRIEELCQLTVGNIVHEENIRCIFIDKSKTDAYHKFGQRHLPVVDRLNSIIDRMMEGKQPKDYLITTRVTETKSARSDLIGGSFNRHKETLGFARPKLKHFNNEEQQTVKDFHSYRKTVNTNLQMLGLKETERNSICGWSVAFSNKQMAETTYLDNKMAYPLIDRKNHLEQWVSKFTFSF